jgi:hypothetical protein
MIEFATKKFKFFATSWNFTPKIEDDEHITPKNIINF